MTTDLVLAKLREKDDHLSGESIAASLGISRAAVWKAVQSLKASGFRIEAVPRRGYRLVGEPDRCDAGLLNRELKDTVFAGRITVLESIDTTNNELKRRSVTEPQNGSVIIADEQTGGRGRLGRSFLSAKGKGLYLSALFCPDVSAETASGITAWTAVAVCRALEKCCGAKAGIKWPNDIVADGRKLCGILTESEIEAETRMPRYIIIGIGINTAQTEEDFGPDLAGIAVSLKQLTQKDISRTLLAKALLEELDLMFRSFPRDAGQYLTYYRDHCVTLGRIVRVLSDAKERTGTAEAVTDSFELEVVHEDGTRQIVSAGEVSVRGIYNYY